MIVNRQDYHNDYDDDVDVDDYDDYDGMMSAG